MSKFGAFCSERGKQSIDSGAKCEQVKESLGAFETFYTENDGFWPKGCYAAGNAIYWNNHPIGKANKIAREICHYSGKYFNYTLKASQNLFHHIVHCKQTCITFNF